MNILQDHLLPVSDDLVSTINAHQRYQKKASWRGSFTFMTWVHSPIGMTGEFALELCYQDAQGEHVLVIDKCVAINKNEILLTNQFVLSVSGPLLLASSRIVCKADKVPMMRVLERLVNPASTTVEKYLETTD